MEVVVPAGDRTVPSWPNRERLIRRAAICGVVVASALALVSAAGSEASAKPTVAAVGALSAAAKPGISGTPITLTGHAEFDGDTHRAWDLGMDRSGTAYMAWLAVKKNSTNERDVFFCTLPPGAKACKGGIQEIVTPDSSSVAGLRLLVSPTGLATLLWYASDAASGTGIIESTSDKGGALTPATLVVNGPSEGSLLAAEFGPNGDIWTVVQTAIDGKTLNIRRSLTAAPQTLRGPSASSFIGVGYASLAFSGHTGILVITNTAQNDYPLYSYTKGSSWTAFAKVGGVETGYGINMGLTAAKAGVILTAVSRPNFYQPVTLKWNGHGFGKPLSTGDHSNCAPNSHDQSADASGRIVDVTNECGEITVANLVDGRHAALLRFGAPKNATVAGGDPQIVSSPRGRAWVAWAVEASSASGGGNLLRVAPLLLPGLDTHKSAHGAHGKITITGPASCQPASSINIGVAAKPAHGWSLVTHTLKLGAKRIGTTLNGAALTPGKRYTLIGAAVFSNGHGRSTVKTSLTFKACPRP
jgi:hypothetical protein